MRTVAGTAALLLWLIVAAAAATDWPPWEAEVSGRPAAAVENSGVLSAAIRFFQHYISPVDGQRCAMYPTCSAYSLKALRKHGPLIGTFLTVDRLYHEGDPIEQQRPISKWGYIRFYDPLESNDFWLGQPQ